MQTAVKIVDRIGELKAMSTDATKNSGDIQNYNEEYQVLRDQLVSLQSEEFNGVSMFVASQGSTDDSLDGVFRVYTTERVDGASSPSVLITGEYLSSTGGNAGATNASVFNSISGGYAGDVTSLHPEE